ncbi:MAG: acyl-CoA dehydrogenase family protein [Chloroflexi bacterium]|nr:acyl-CoA dehydrogenase family protein [Chloroflexota bacterium]
MDLTLTPFQEHWIGVARDFVKREIEPTVLERDKIRDPLARMPWDWLRAASKLGLRTLPFPKEVGGQEAGIITLCMIGEELAAGDLGFAVMLDQVWKFVHLFTEAMTPAQRERYLPPFAADDEALTCLALTEPGAGSDHQGYYMRPDIAFYTVAKRDGDAYVINGEKQFPSNGNVAKLYFVIARLDPTMTLQQSGTAFLVTSDNPGLKPTKYWDKIGQRLCVNGSFVFENCRVSADDMLLGEGDAMSIRSSYLPGSKPEAAATTLGVGRAAFERALAYARERVRGSQPIVEQQVMATMLADMSITLEVARQYIWRAAWLAEHRDPRASVEGLLCKAFASEGAFKVCRSAMEVFGSKGVTRDLPMEKYLRDASTFFHSDGTNQMALLRSARTLAGQQAASSLAGF